MSRLVLAALLLALPFPALAADAKAPVGEIMAAATNNWLEMGSDAEEPPPYVDYFGEDFLKRLYSRDFVAKYREAAKYPAYDDGGSPFSYDPIVGGQDGCGLKDLTIAEGAAAGGKTDVDVSFDNTHCFPEREPDWQPVRLVFKVIEEDGRPVIDDVLRKTDDGTGSLKEEIGELARYGSEGGEGEGAE